MIYINKLIIAVIVILLVGVGAYFILGKNSYQTNSQSQSTTQKIAGNSVAIQNFTFSPSTITVKAGEQITWTNQDSVGHSATADDGSFDTDVLSNGESKSITFSKAGTYPYHCKVHPNMKGTVVVTE